LWVLWLFLDLLAAESLVVLVINIFSIFVVSLAVVVFANGLWMSVNGFMVLLHTFNVFWRFVFNYIDFQAYVFKGMKLIDFYEGLMTSKPQVRLDTTKTVQSSSTLNEAISLQGEWNECWIRDWVR
jgi:hypothetical protein